MSDAVLTRAAARIREQADAATPGPWEAAMADDPGVYTLHPDALGGPVCDPSDTYPRGLNRPQASMEHIALWNPERAALVADLLESIARSPGMPRRAAEALAYSILGEEPPPPTCGKPVGGKPWWMGVDQYDPCYCLLPPGHEGACKCSHMGETQ